MSGLKCTVEIGRLQIIGLLDKFNGKKNTKSKTIKKSLASLDSIAKKRQRISAVKSQEYASIARAKREQEKREKEKTQETQESSK